MPSSRKQLIRSLAGLCLLMSFAVSGGAAGPPSKYEEWRNGPVQWIMTSEEPRAWRAVSNEDEAIRFIDLFWARRDPTPGTAPNEFRAEFDGRVKAADEKFAEGRKRGAMSDRGRVFIVLGSPTFATTEASKTTSQMAVGDARTANDPTGGRVMGTRDEWRWEREDARKYDMPRIEVVFIETIGARRSFNRDLSRPDFLRAAPAAIRKAVVDPTLTEAPEWAARGGLEPMTLTFVAQTPAPTLVTEAREPVVVPDPVPTVPAAPARPDPLPVKAIDSGASRLTLLRDVASIATETKIDPFLNMKPVNVFHPQDELGWVLQYCSGNLEAPTLTFTVRLTGSAKGRPITLSAPPDEMVPDRIKALPGCYLLRAAIPLDEMAAGAYQLEVKVENPDKGKSETLKKEFRIE